MSSRAKGRPVRDVSPGGVASSKLTPETVQWLKGQVANVDRNGRVAICEKIGCADDTLQRMLTGCGVRASTAKRVEEGVDNWRAQLLKDPNPMPQEIKSPPGLTAGIVLRFARSRPLLDRVDLVLALLEDPSVKAMVLKGEQLH